MAGERGFESTRVDDDDDDDDDDDGRGDDSDDESDRTAGDGSDPIADDAVGVADRWEDPSAVVASAADASAAVARGDATASLRRRGRKGKPSRARDDENEDSDVGAMGHVRGPTVTIGEQRRSVRARKKPRRVASDDDASGDERDATAEQRRRQKKRGRGRPRRDLGETTTEHGERRASSWKEAENRNAERGERRIRSEDVADLAMAYELSLDCERLTEFERAFLPRDGHHREEDFIAIRNALIVKWRSRPREYLTAETATDLFKKKFSDLAVAVHKYLTTFGYINFGIMKPSKHAFEEFAATIQNVTLNAANFGSTFKQKKFSVVVIGAGMSGLAAARHLSNLGHDVVVLEARRRVGGRVNTREFDGPEGTKVAVDLGGSILSGSNGNPLFVMSRQLGLIPHAIQTECDLYDENGNAVNEEMDKDVEATFNRSLEDMSEYRRNIERSVANTTSFGAEIEKRINKELLKLPMEKRQKAKDIYNWHIANMEFANASRARELSLMQWDQDDAYDFSGDHVVVRGGNQKFIEALSQGLTIWYGHCVSSITDLGVGRGVIVNCGADLDVMADACIVTVPLGVLKRDLIKFFPVLPCRKIKAIRNIGFGVLNKVVLVFPEKFWDDAHDAFGFVQSRTSDRGRYFLTYTYDKAEGNNVLIALCAGDAGIEVELHEPSVVVTDLMTYLRSAFGKQGKTVPDPISFHVTKWRSDKYTYGSYSSCSVDTTGEDYDEMAKPVGNIHFAGEATTRQYPATMHGAFLSGLREAGRISMKCDDACELDKIAEITVGINDWYRYKRTLDESAKLDGRSNSKEALAGYLGSNTRFIDMR